MYCSGRSKQRIQGQNINYVGGGIIRYIAIVDMNNDYKTQEYLRVYALKAGERNDNYKDYIQIVKLYMVKFGCFNKSKNKFS